MAKSIEATYSDCSTGYTWIWKSADYQTADVKDKEHENMTLNTMMKRLLDADTQTLVRAGYINGNLDLTEKGRAALLTVLFVTNKTELVKMAQEELDEAEERKA